MSLTDEGAASHKNADSSQIHSCFMIIPPDSLPRETLRGILEEFISRDGTDYGELELSLEQKVCSLLEQVKTGQVFITFDEVTESVNLVSAEAYVDPNDASRDI